MTSRYDNATSFVPAIREAPPDIKMPDAVEPIHIETVFTPTASSGRDALGARDRATGLIYRMIIPAAVVVLAGLAVVILYSIALIVLDAGTLVPYMLDRALIFLIVLAGGAFVMFDRESQRDYDHSHAGIERHRIDTAAGLRSEELEAEYRLRQIALSAQLKLLGVSDDEGAE